MGLKGQRRTSGGKYPVNWAQQQAGSGEFSRSKRVDESNQNCRGLVKGQRKLAQLFQDWSKNRGPGGGASYSLSTDGTNPVEVKNTGKREGSEPYGG